MWAVVRLLPLALPVLPGWIYSAFMESSFRQATLGKMALGIVVTDLEGRKISFRKAARRYFVKVLFFGFVWAGFTAKKQALHDKVVGCLVVVRR